MCVFPRDNRQVVCLLRAGRSQLTMPGRPKTSGVALSQRELSGGLSGTSCIVAAETPFLGLVASVRIVATRRGTEEQATA